MRAHTLSVRAHVGASPEVVYDAVSDLARMASWSEEYIGSWRFWRGAPRPGVRFVGWNRNGRRVWCTTCRVIAADRPTWFAFESGILGLPVARWSYPLLQHPAAATLSRSGVICAAADRRGRWRAGWGGPSPGRLWTSGCIGTKRACG